MKKAVLPILQTNKQTTNQSTMMLPAGGIMVVPVLRKIAKRIVRDVPRRAPASIFWKIVQVNATIKGRHFLRIYIRKHRKAYPLISTEARKKKARKRKARKRVLSEAINFSKRKLILRN